MQILNEFGIQGIFRNFLPGIFFVASILFMKYDSGANYLKTLESHPWSYAVLATIAGNIIYLCHRSSTNIIFDAVRSDLIDTRGNTDQQRASSYVNEGSVFFPRESLVLTVERWKHDGVKAALTHLKRWADFVHHLYCASLASFIAAMTPLAISDISHSGRSCSISIMGTAFFFLGFIGDYRRHIMELILYHHQTHGISRWPENQIDY